MDDTCKNRQNCRSRDDGHSETYSVRFETKDRFGDLGCCAFGWSIRLGPRASKNKHNVAHSWTRSGFSRGPTGYRHTLQTTYRTWRLEVRFAMVFGEGEQLKQRFTYFALLADVDCRSVTSALGLKCVIWNGGCRNQKYSDFRNLLANWVGHFEAPILCTCYAAIWEKKWISSDRVFPLYARS